MKIDHLINGQSVSGSDYFETINPATQEVLGEVVSAGQRHRHPLRLGRGYDNDVILDDSHVGARHAVQRAVRKEDAAQADGQARDAELARLGNEGRTQPVDVDRIAEHVGHQLERDALVLERDADMTAAKAGKGKIWLGHPASMGHGVDGLQAHCNRIVFFSQDWNLEYADQILERIGPMRQYQEGRRDGVFIDYIVAANTVDEVVMARRSGKATVQNLLMDYMKRKKR